MGEVKHTPGPWVVQSDGRFASWVGQPGPVGALAKIEQYAKGYGPTEEARLANARLIAAAPEMFEALKAALRDCDWGLEEGDQLPPWIEQAQAALSKAQAS